MNYKIFFLTSVLLTSAAQAKIEKGEEDVLSTVSQKLTQIEKQLKDQRIFVAPAVFEWAELRTFREDLMFTVAHDPMGPTTKEVPAELAPAYLTQKLKISFSKLESSVFQVGDLNKSDEWTTLKTDMDKFISYREEFLYAPARTMIKSGSMTAHLERLEEVASIMLKGKETSKNLSVRVIDPVIEGLSQELNRLNVSIGQLEEFRKPLPAEPKTVFIEKNYHELSLFAAAAAFLGILSTFFFQWVYRSFTKAEKIAETEPTSTAGFNYYEWLKQLETNLKAFKVNEDKLVEECVHLKHLGTSLESARRGLNLADNHQDYYESLELLNGSAPKLEEYFEKMNVKKNAEMSRRLIKQVVQLCDAIESRQEINLTENREKLKASKVDGQVIELNAA